MSPRFTPNPSWYSIVLMAVFALSPKSRFLRRNRIREQLREKVREHIVIQPIEITACIFCQSTNLKKFGVRHNKYGDIQRFLCASRERTFSVNLGFERMKHSPQGITTAMQLYFSGESLRNTARSLSRNDEHKWNFLRAS